MCSFFLNVFIIILGSFKVAWNDDRFINLAGWGGVLAYKNLYLVTFYPKKNFIRILEGNSLLFWPSNWKIIANNFIPFYVKEVKFDFSYVMFLSRLIFFLENSIKTMNILSSHAKKRMCWLPDAGRKNFLRDHGRSWQLSAVVQTQPRRVRDRWDLWWHSSCASK